MWLLRHFRTAPSASSPPPPSQQTLHNLVVLPSHPIPASSQPPSIQSTYELPQRAPTLTHHGVRQPSMQSTYELPRRAPTHPHHGVRRPRRHTTHPSPQATPSSQPPQATPSSQPLLVILVLSHRSEGTEARRSLRTAWTARRWPLTSVGNTSSSGRLLARVLFVLGGAPSLAAEGISNAGDADELHVVAPEGKRTLSLKVLYALRWLYDGSRGGLQPAFVAKTDDDAYVCVGALVAAMRAHVSAQPAAAFWYFGAFTLGRPVQVRRGYRWEDAPYHRLFKLATYPDYAQGALYALSGAAVRAAVQSAAALGLYNRSRHPSTDTPVNEDALVGTLLHMSLGAAVLCRPLAVRVYPQTLGRRGEHSRLRRPAALAAALQMETESACTEAERGKLVAVHKLGPEDVMRCARLGGRVRSWRSRRCTQPPAEVEALISHARDVRARAGLLLTRARLGARPWSLEAAKHVKAADRSAAEAAAVGTSHSDVAGVAGKAPAASQASSRRQPGGVQGPTGTRSAEQVGRAGVGVRETQSPRRVAFCFLLAYGDVTQPHVWLSFFGRSDADETAAGPLDALFSVYVHQDVHTPTQLLVRRPLWRNALLPVGERVATAYRNGTSLELARLTLFRYAYWHDESNYKFVLLSESCVPLHPLVAVHRRLLSDNRPRVRVQRPWTPVLLRSNCAEIGIHATCTHAPHGGAVRGGRFECKRAARSPVVCAVCDSGARDAGSDDGHDARSHGEWRARGLCAHRGQASRQAVGAVADATHQRGAPPHAAAGSSVRGGFADRGARFPFSGRGGGTLVSDGTGRGTRLLQHARVPPRLSTGHRRRHRLYHVPAFLGRKELVPRAAGVSKHLSARRGGA